MYIHRGMNLLHVISLFLDIEPIIYGALRGAVTCHCIYSCRTSTHSVAEVSMLYTHMLFSFEFYNGDL